MSDSSLKSLIVDIINSEGNIIGEKEVFLWNNNPPYAIVAELNGIRFVCRYNKEQGVYIVENL